MKFRWFANAEPGARRALSRLLAVALIVPAAAAPAQQPVLLQVSKSQKTLQVVQGDQVVRTYRISSGMGGTGAKFQLGDKKTPVGHYRIVGFKPDSKFHYFMQINYPNLQDAWHGYTNRLIDARQFRAIMVANRNRESPPQNTALGGYIGIHGVGEVTPEKQSVHAQFDWTEGCIALTNDEITELSSYVLLGTPVVIRD
jgi:murein L,D-transpeptidase YafK